MRIKADEIKRARFSKAFDQQHAEDLHGVGYMDIKPLGSDLVIVARDGKTAKGMWACNGQYADNSPAGPVARYTCGLFAVDFLKEGGGWKIWHMQYLEDINCPCGDRWWAGARKTYKAFPEFAPIAQIQIPEPTRREQLREYYHTQREFTRFPMPPVPYETFAETFSYGY